MWFYNFIELVLMSAGFGIGSFAWYSALPDDSPGKVFWWLGGMAGLGVGWTIAKCFRPRVRKASVVAEPMLAPQAKQPPAPKPPTRSEAITLLAALQREARFVDFVQEPLAGYSDAQVGAAARDVHRDCGVVLKRLFALRPAVEQEEGAEVEIPAGFDPTRWRLTGNVVGQPPFHGRVVHPGWEATTCDLPTWSGNAATARIVAPAEVELK